MGCGFVCNLLISHKRDAICLFYNKRGGLGCGLVCNILISQKRDAASCCFANQVRTRWQTGDGGRRVDRKRLDGGRDQTAGFLILIKKGSIYLKRRISYFNTETMSFTSAFILVERDIGQIIEKRSFEKVVDTPCTRQVSRWESIISFTSIFIKVFS